MSRRRLRVTTDKGNECAIALSRQEKLFDGAVLLLDDESGGDCSRRRNRLACPCNRSTQPQPLSSDIAVATCTGASASPDRFYALPSMDLSRNIWHDLHHSSAPGGSRKLQMDSRGLLATLQHADSFFPSGAVSFSWGLEALRADGLVQSADDVALFAAGQLRHRWATADRPVLAATYTASDDLEAVAAIDRLQDAMALPLELRLGSRRMGGIAAMRRLRCSV